MILQLIVSFFSIGLFAFGGGYAILSFLQHEVVRRGLMEPGRFTDMIAIAQSTPGTIAINLATFVGYETAGIWGSLLASIAVILPGTVLTVVFARLFFHFYESPALRAVFLGLRPAVLGLIAAAAWRIGQVALVSWQSIVVAVVCGLVIYRWKLHPAILIAGSALAGILFF